MFVRNLGWITITLGGLLGVYMKGAGGDRVIMKAKVMRLSTMRAAG